ncbi:MAG: SDR family NAD(P)-dependent oxidoreductase [Actinobacteria bacterium]|nr:SDR family NAD(P)-dependent oxidoreductase [Actinomycetota bacterium]
MRLARRRGPRGGGDRRLRRAARPRRPRARRRTPGAAARKHDGDGRRLRRRARRRPDRRRRLRLAPRSPGRVSAVTATEGRLAGTVALVTGASSGIGEAAARNLAAAGADVALLARRTGRIEALAAELGGGGVRALAIEADVSDREQAEAAVARAAAELGRLDTVVNNAGVMLLGPILEAPVAEWEQMVEVNLLGLLYVAKASLPHLLAAAESAPRRVADLVNISSVAGRVTRLGSGAYSATKHAVGAFSESLRQEVTGRHVRVSLIEPGAVATELFSHNRPEVQERLKGRFGEIERLEAEDIAEVIAFIVTRGRRVAINEVLLRPTEQTG